MIKATKFQEAVHTALAAGESLLIVAPTGLGKTFAATGDVSISFRRIIYSVPLRALGDDIRRVASGYERNGEKLTTAIHHGAARESTLFGEEFVVTTYDQLVCAVPGLPLSLPLKAGHAIAGALMMSRLVLDEAHLAWAISKDALSILLAIVKTRSSLGLQTVVMTATLPDAIAQLIAKELGLTLIRVGEGSDISDDKGLALRNRNRQVKPSLLKIDLDNEKKINIQPLDDRLVDSQTKVIYFANQVETLQKTFDRLIARSVNKERIIVLHNRMPREWRKAKEQQVHEFFGGKSGPNDKILLTNQVAEAGLDISAPLVISDPAPVDTLVQRAGRCARWFRSGLTEGEFVVLDVIGIARSKTNEAAAKAAKEFIGPYKPPELTEAALKKFPDNILSWKVESQWVNDAWGGEPKKAKQAAERALLETTFALNLFDRASQEQRPNEIASTFREVLSVEVAVAEGSEIFPSIISGPSVGDRLREQLEHRELPDTSSISLGRAYKCFNDNRDSCAVIRYSKEENQLEIISSDRPQLGDVVILPSTVAYLHEDKGLCFGDADECPEAIRESEWKSSKKVERTIGNGEGHRQTLSEHTLGVMKRATQKLSTPASPYRQTLLRVLRKLEPQLDEVANERLADLVVQLVRVAVAFHDLGKAHERWQQKARGFDPGCSPELIGRTSTSKGRMGIPHTPPGYHAALVASQLLLGDNAEKFKLMLRAIALASCRHHSSLFNPSKISGYTFTPHELTLDFIREMLSQIGAPPHVLERADEILAASQTLPNSTDVPLMLPTDDLFPLYALVGRAILLGDREDAARGDLEQWQ